MFSMRSVIDEWSALSPNEVTKRYRLAMWAPLPPLKNGIADYAVELAEELSKSYEIEFIVDVDYQPVAEIKNRYRVIQYPQFTARNEASPFDVIIYQLGGSIDHYFMYEAIRNW